jgi:hypothetical protein
VLDYGWFYKPVHVPWEYEFGDKHQCFKNAINLTLVDDSLIYCEGFVLSKSGLPPIPHAWVTDGHGRAFDNTLPQSALAYVGIPFKSLFVSMTCLKTRATISFLDDWMNNYPLRNELGDRPDEWLESRGRGLSRLLTDVDQI